MPFLFSKINKKKKKKNKRKSKMQPGSTQLLTPSEVEEAFKNAPIKREVYAIWRDSNNITHRDGDLPACVWKDGEQHWYQHGELHRANGLPAIIAANGTMLWHENGEWTGNDLRPPPNAPEIFFNRLPGQKTKSASKRQ